MPGVLDAMIACGLELAPLRVRAMMRGVCDR